MAIDDDAQPDRDGDEEGDVLPPDLAAFLRGDPIDSQERRAFPAADEVDELRQEVASLRSRLATMSQLVRWLQEQVSPRTAPSGGASFAFPVVLVQTGGTNGGPTSAATYTYTVKDLAGNVLATGVAVAFARWNGSRTPATHGLAYKTSAGAYVISCCDEAPGTTNECPTP